MNNMIHVSIESIPAKLVLGYDQKNYADRKLVNLLRKTAESQDFYDNVRDNQRLLALKTTKKLKEYNKIYFDKRHKSPTQYKSGEYVLVRDTTVKPGENKKIKPAYKSLYLVKKALNK